MGDFDKLNQRMQALSTGEPAVDLDQASKVFRSSLPRTSTTANSHVISTSSISGSRRGSGDFDKLNRRRAGLDRRIWA
jgi:hypothetical protein